jgi:hypothetical protein
MREISKDPERMSIPCRDALMHRGVGKLMDGRIGKIQVVIETRLKR